MEEEADFCFLKTHTHKNCVFGVIFSDDKGNVCIPDYLFIQIDVNQDKTIIKAVLFSRTYH